MSTTAVIPSTSPHPSQQSTRTPHRPDGTPVRRRELLVPLAAATVAVVAWLPFLHAPLTSDESGFLLLGEHLRHGTSLYGDYWVDRPPLLLWLFRIAGAITPLHATNVGVVAPGVKVLGAAAAGVAVVLSWVLAAVLRPTGRASRTVAPIAMAILVSSPKLGLPETNGELLALPFVLGGLAALLVVLRDPAHRRAAGWAATAGGSAACAALIKQNMVDVFVFAGVAAVTLGHRRADHRPRNAVAFVLGAGSVLGCAVLSAAAQGTRPGALWRAVVTFRVHASAVIGASATGSTTQRLSHLLTAFVLSGAAPMLVIGVLALVVPALRRGRGPSPHRASGPGVTLVWPLLAMVTWELVGVLMGGSYWLHYLTGVLPGLVLLVCLTASRWRTHRVAAALTAACLLYAAAASALAWSRHVETPVAATPDTRVMTYLRSHAAPDDGVVVAFGHPDILAGSGLSSSYPQLWSLPVRVSDPHLTQFQRALSAGSGPRWVVVSGDSLASWGLDATNAQRYLAQHYTEQTSYGDWHIWLRSAGR